jgi:trehalose 6-phosphate phosphatase
MRQQTTIGLETVLVQRPLGLAFDIDGTLSPMTPTPGGARLYPGVAELLKRARDHTGVHVAIMTGRGIEDGASIINIDGLTYSGTHGLEWSDGLPGMHPPQVKPEALAYREAGISLLNLVEKHLPDLPGVVIQRKRIGGSLHYRLSPHPAETRRALFALLNEPAHMVGMKLGEGKRIVEILPPLAIDKGTALHRFAEQFGLRGIVFAGDDRTDLDGVQEIALMQRKGLAALSIVVRQTDTLPVMLSNADIVVDGVPGMVALLRKMVEML